MRLRFSTPQAITTALAPAAIWAGPKLTAYCDEPHCESTVVHATSIDPPYDNHAVRVMFIAWAPTLLMQPPITCPTAPDSTPLRASKPVRTGPSTSAGWVAASAPPRLPIGDRSASTMTTSRTLASSPSVGSVVAIPGGDHRIPFQDREQPCQLPAVGPGQPGTEIGAQLGVDPLEVLHHRHRPLGEHDPPYAAVRRIGAPLDQAPLDQAIDRHPARRRRDLQQVGQLPLGQRTVLGQERDHAGLGRAQRDLAEPDVEGVAEGARRPQHRQLDASGISSHDPHTLSSTSATSCASIRS